MNHQPPEKPVRGITTELDVVSIFPTIQGEGPYSGERAVFIRLAGCNLQCPGCDTEYTHGREKVKVKDILNTVMFAADPPTLVVITGGEPFRQDITTLANSLRLIGYRVQVETNGSLPPSEGLDADVVIVCSPKTATINPVLKARANFFKYVMHADSVVEEDGLPRLALGNPSKPYVARPPLGAKVYLQPMDSQNIAQNHRNQQAVIDSCMRFGYCLQLQVHKIIGME